MASTAGAALQGHAGGACRANVCAARRCAATRTGRSAPVRNDPAIARPMPVVQMREKCDMCVFSARTCVR